MILDAVKRYKGKGKCPVFFCLIGGYLKSIEEMEGNQMNKEMFRALRLFHDLSQLEFAKTLGVSHSTVDGVETGRRSITPFIRAKVVTAYHIDEAFLSFYDKYKKTESNK